LRVDRYGFGKIVINGKRYGKDVIITPKGEVKEWWRTRGHEVRVKDLEPIEGEEFDVLIIGTGYFGIVKVLSEVEEWAKKRRVELVAMPTKEACKVYNEVSGKKKVAAALHLTC
jgi:hypothetical protein